MTNKTDKLANCLNVRKTYKTDCGVDGTNPQLTPNDQVKEMLIKDKLVLEG